MFGVSASITKGRIIAKFEERLIEHNWKINKLEERAAFKVNTISQFLIKCDDNEKFSRRNCLRIHGIGSKKYTKINALQKLKEYYESVQVSFVQEDIDRAHRLGME